MIVHQTPKTSKKGIRIDFASNTGKGGYNWHTHVTIQISLIQGLIRYPPFSGFLTFLAILGFFGFFDIFRYFRNCDFVKKWYRATICDFEICEIRFVSELCFFGFVFFRFCDFGISIWWNCDFLKFEFLRSPIGIFWKWSFLMDSCFSDSRLESKITIKIGSPLPV